jgi:hypothetical protein
VLGNNAHDNGRGGIGAGDVDEGLFDSKYICTITLTECFPLITDGSNGGILVYNIVGTRPNTTIYKVTDTQVTGNTIVVSNTSTNTAAGLLDKASPIEPSIFSDPTNIWANNTYQVPAMPWTKKSCDWGENGSHPNRIDWSAWIIVHPESEVLQLQ